MLEKFERYPLTFGPTPIEKLGRLSKHLGGKVQIYAKREDCNSGLAFGGNKTRKLEFLVAEARDQGAKTLVSGGALQSNHCRQTAAAAARFGFKCILVLTGERPKQPSANLLLDELFGAEIIHVADREDRDRILQETFNQAAEKGMRPYLVPYGGSSPTGALGYAFAMKELMEQDLQADWIVFATSSGGTHAGLLLGQRVFGYKGKVLGISVDESENWLKEHVSDLASLTSEKLGERIEFTPGEVLADASHCSAGRSAKHCASSATITSRLATRAELVAKRSSLCHSEWPHISASRANCRSLPMATMIRWSAV